jgi:hypothetical protein
MNRAIVAIVVSMLAAGCATIPATTIYRQSEGQISQTIYVLPVTDDTVSGHIDDVALASLRKDLIQTLKASGRFLAVYETLPVNNQKETTRVRSKVTQFDTFIRRMVMVTELLQDNSDRPFLRFVTQTELVSIVWPIDYVAVMKRAGKAAIKDVVDKMVSSIGNK